MRPPALKLQLLTLLLLASLCGCQSLGLLERYRPSWLEWEQGAIADLPLVRALPLRPEDFSFFGGGGKQAAQHRGQLPPLHFELNSATLSAEAEQELDLVAQEVITTQGRLIVSGFTDSSGSPSYNLMLGEQRALGVRKQLLARGVPPGQIITVSFGQDMPIAPANPAANRRVEFGLLEGE